jgi:hypothetical protein
MREGSFFSDVYNGIADAVADIREKVVEEPWWGKSLSEGQSQEPPAPQWPQAREPGSLTHSMEREPSHEQDMDIDR